MKPTYQELSYAIFQLATEEQQTDDIPQYVLDRLAELGMVHLEVDSSPQLTEQGKNAFTAMEAGDTVPEFHLSN
jgi:adenosine deaminase